MMNNKILNHVMQLVTCALLLTAVAINKNGKVAGCRIGDNSSHTEAALTDATNSSSPEAALTDATNSGDLATAASLAAASGDTMVLSSIGIADRVIGYAGTTPVEISIANGRIVRVTPLKNDESPTFFKSLTDEGLFERWNGMTPDEAINANVNAVSGATYSSAAVISTVRLTVADYVDSQPSALSGIFSWKLLITLLVTLCAVLLPFISKSRTARLAQLALNVAVIGFWSHSFISMSLIVNAISNGLSLSTGIIPAVLLLVGFVMPFFGKPSHYCNHVCPLGSLQELAGVVKKHKWQPSAPLLKWLNGLREALWIALLLVMAVGAGFDLMDYEAFTVFMLDQASPVVIVMACAFVVLSVFTPRPYCRFVCPTGSILKYSQSTK